jgi:hypothetical protein
MLVSISIADPGCLSGSDFFPYRIPDQNFFHPGSRIHRKEFKYFNPKKMFFMLSEIWSWLFIPDPDPDFLPIPDPGSRGQKGTGPRIRNIGFYELFNLWIAAMLVSMSCLFYDGHYVGFYELFILWMAAMLVSMSCLFYEWLLCCVLFILWMAAMLVSMSCLFYEWPLCWFLCVPPTSEWAV